MDFFNDENHWIRDSHSGTIRYPYSNDLLWNWIYVIYRSVYTARNSPSESYGW